MNFEAFYENLRSVLQRDYWGTIDWDGDDATHFKEVLGEAWDKTVFGEAKKQDSKGKVFVWNSKGYTEDSGKS